MKRIAIILVIALMAVFVFFKLYTTATKSTPVVVVAPISEPRTIGSMDQSFLKIKLLTHKYEVSLFEKSIRTSQLDSIENFIVTNESQINRDKIAVVGNEKMKEFQAISSLLKKNGITRFIVNSE